MQKTLRNGFILMAMLPGLIGIPACSKNTTSTEAPAVQRQEQASTPDKSKEELEKERLERQRKFMAEKIKFMYEDIYFSKGSYALQPEAQQILKRKAQWLRENPDIAVIIEGHTDERGSKENNFALGDRRAGAVKSFLIREGIESPRLIAVSFGNERPIDSGKTEPARSKNRRVHFVVEEVQ